jgi:hypothetical protein
MKGELVASGATSSLTYALRRSIPGLPAALPVYEISPTTTRLFATLHLVEPGFYVQSALPVQGFYRDLPWFLHDLRPSGFLGRLVPRLHPELELPLDILFWTSNHALRWLYKWGVDTVGCFIIGDPAFQRFQQQNIEVVAELERDKRYPELARMVMALGVPGSSAAGEQPKFLATKLSGSTTRQVLVKFSPKITDAASRRTADLLRCEHHALQSLVRAGIPAAETELIEAEDRVFLEVIRFDRQGDGRLGLVSLLALGMQHGVELQSWTAAAAELVQAEVIPAVAYERMVWLDRFGMLIGNTDRHAGNLSFFFNEGRVGSVAPVYDMLPMAYAVRSGEFATSPLTPPIPGSYFPLIWRQTWAVALEFWEIVAKDCAIHPALRLVAEANRGRLLEYQGLLNRLPVD